MTLLMIRRLAAGLNIPTDVLVQEYDLKQKLPRHGLPQDWGRWAEGVNGYKIIEELNKGVSSTETG